MGAVTEAATPALLAVLEAGPGTIRSAPRGPRAACPAGGRAGSSCSCRRPREGSRGGASRRRPSPQARGRAHGPAREQAQAWATPAAPPVEGRRRAGGLAPAARSGAGRPGAAPAAAGAGAGDGVGAGGGADTAAGATGAGPGIVLGGAGGFGAQPTRIRVTRATRTCVITRSPRPGAFGVRRRYAGPGRRVKTPHRVKTSVTRGGAAAQK